MPKMYILGCSHAAGAELDGDGTATSYNLKNSFAAQFANLLEYDAVNLAEPGGSNDGIFRKFMDIIADRNFNKTDDIIFASWTGYHRTEVFHIAEDRFVQMSMGTYNFKSKELQQAHDIFMKMWCSHDDIGNYNKLKNVLAVDSISKSYGIEVIHHETFAKLGESIKLSLMENDFSEKMNVNWINEGDCFMDWVEERKYKKTPAWHYELQAHKDYAQYLLNRFNIFHEL